MYTIVDISMRALLKTSWQVGIEEVPEPTLRSPDEVLIEVLLAGVCRTDIYVSQGLLGGSEQQILGHEFCGRVLEVGPEVSRIQSGDLVSANPFLACGQCAFCRQNEPHFCSQRRQLGVSAPGCFAERIVLPEQILLPLPPETSLGRGAYVEPIAAALGVLSAPIGPGQRGWIQGEHRIAQLTAMLLRARGFERLHLGVQGPQESVDFVVESQAQEIEFKAALGALRPGGCLVLKSRPVGPVAVDFAEVVAKRLRLVGQSYGSFAEAVEMSALPGLEDLFGQSYALAAWQEAFAESQSGQKKVFLRP